MRNSLFKQVNQVCVVLLQASRVKVGAGVSEQWGVSEHLLVVPYFFFETNPPLLLVGLHVEATTSDRTAYF